MPRRKRREQALDVQVDSLERELAGLRRSIDQVRYNLMPFRPHDEALGALVRQMIRTINVLRGRDPDYQRPHEGHMANGPQPRAPSTN